MQPIAKDLGEAVFSVLDNKEKTINKNYNIAGKSPISYKELLKTVAKNLNRKIIFIHIPYKISYISAHIYNFISKKAVISVEQVMRMNEDKAFDYTKATNDFNFAPVCFKEGIAKEVEEFKASLK